MTERCTCHPTDPDAGARGAGGADPACPIDGEALVYMIEQRPYDAHQEPPLVLTQLAARFDVELCRLGTFRVDIPIWACNGDCCCWFIYSDDHYLDRQSYVNEDGWCQGQDCPCHRFPRELCDWGKTNGFVDCGWPDNGRTTYVGDVALCEVHAEGAESDPVFAEAKGAEIKAELEKEQYQT